MADVIKNVGHKTVPTPIVDSKNLVANPSIYFSISGSYF